MEWYVFYGSGRMLRAAGSPQSNAGWTLKPFANEGEAVQFAIGCVENGLAVSVGEIGADIPAKYRTADIASKIQL